MPSEESKENIIQLDDDFDIVRDILDKKSKEKSPQQKLKRFYIFLIPIKNLVLYLLYCLVF